MLKIIWLLLCVSLPNFEATAPSFLNDDFTTEAPPCKDGQFTCADGSCVSLQSKCNGTIECDDGSDETFALCRNYRCDKHQFRCAYGACVDGLPCDGKLDCADNSDELLTRCNVTETWKMTVPDTCKNGQILVADHKCDGKVDCSDGSDETIARCTEMDCGSKFKCAYGGCVHEHAKCNGVRDCRDGSDESYDLCHGDETVTPNPEPTTTDRPNPTACRLPPSPENGKYDVVFDKVERGIKTLVLRYTCDEPYELMGQEFPMCSGGFWWHEFPKCVLYCKLPVGVQSIHYYCLESQNSSIEHSRHCEGSEPPGTIVQPVCKYPEFYYPGTLTQMYCRENGEWNYEPLCVPDCGRASPRGEPIEVGKATRQEMPWHAGVYTKLKHPFEQICGGTIISSKIVVSAAHCFWADSLQPVHHFAVAFGKLKRGWFDLQDSRAQKRNILEIKIPARFSGVQTHFQDDIALLMMDRSILFNIHVRPICLDFDSEFDARQLQAGNIGKVAGWGLTSENGQPSELLKIVEMPYVPIEECLAKMPFSYKEYITVDKICAGYSNGTAAVCKGDSGGGLVFPDVKNGIQRYYLRGVVSTTQTSDGVDACNFRSLASFTHMLRHETFISTHFGQFTNHKFQFVDVSKFSEDKKWEW